MSAPGGTCPRTSGGVGPSQGVALVAGFGPKDSICGRAAESVAAALEAAGWVTILCISSDASKDDLRAALQSLREAAWPGCSCVLYVDGHADADAEGELSVLPWGERGRSSACPARRHKIKSGTQSLDDPREESAGFSFTWLRREVSEIPAQRILLLLDCCYSGQLVEDIRRSSKRFWKGRSLTVVTSCGAHERSHCWAGARTSPFAMIAVDALTGRFSEDHCQHDACPCGRSRMRALYKSQGRRSGAAQLAEWVRAHVSTYEQQHPLVESFGGDFLV